MSKRFLRLVSPLLLFILASCAGPSPKEEAEKFLAEFTPKYQSLYYKYGEAQWLANKVAHLRVFEDETGKMNLSLLDVNGAALVISQFTLYANAQRGRRPDFINAARPEEAESLIAYFVQQLRAEGVPTQTGVFRAMMQVEIHNDGPVTILLEREPNDHPDT